MCRILPAVLAAAILLAGCGGDAGSQRAPVSAADGLRVSGTFAGSRLNVDDGEPEVVLGDCDPADGPDGDFCIVSRSIGGSSVTLVVENPQLLAARGEIGVRNPGCQGFACEAVDDFLVVDLRVDATSLRASSGIFDIRRADTRYAGTFRVRFPDGGSLSGEFDVAIPA
ncbi:MAG TPA: hypothetical protein VGA69_04830 [Nitriliruptorales bacterium]